MARQWIRLPHRQLALWLVLAAVSTAPAMEAAPLTEVIGQEPLAVQLVIPEMLRQAVADPDGSREKHELWLSLDGVRPPAADVEVRVFINLPDPARVPSSVESLHYAGSFTFHREPVAPERMTFLIDLSRVLRRLSPAERQVEGEMVVTLVAVPLRKRDTLGGLAIPFERLRLTAPPPV